MNIYWYFHPIRLRARRRYLAREKIRVQDKIDEIYKELQTYRNKRKKGEFRGWADYYHWQVLERENLSERVHLDVLEEYGL